MDQLKELLAILKDTPEMALWGIVIFCLFTLAKLAGWVVAISKILTLGITKYFAYKDHFTKIKEIELSQSKATELQDLLDAKLITNSKELFLLLDVIKKDSPFVHNSDIRSAIKILKENL